MLRLSGRSRIADRQLQAVLAHIAVEEHHLFVKGAISREQGQVVPFCSSCRLKPLQSSIGLGIGTALVPGQGIFPAHHQDPVHIGGIGTARLLSLCQHPHRIPGLGHGTGQVLGRNGHHISPRPGKVHGGDDRIGARHRGDGTLHIAQCAVLRIRDSQVCCGIKIGTCLHPDGLCLQPDRREMVFRGLLPSRCRRTLPGRRFGRTLLSHRLEHFQQARFQFTGHQQTRAAHQQYQRQHRRPVQSFFLFPASFSPHPRHLLLHGFLPAIVAQTDHVFHDFFTSDPKSKSLSTIELVGYRQHTTQAGWRPKETISGECSAFFSSQ